jgi:diadenosine tetraphosphate (Ap4A) HIT family hydrolase
MAEMRIDNAREPEQVRRMQEAQNKGVCYFCELFKEPGEERFLHIGKNWFVKVNDFPYPGSVHHYLIVSRDHVTDLSHVNSLSQYELFGAINYLQNILGVKGYSVFVRSGDMAYTGATLDHLHFHFLVGVEKPNPGEKDIPETVIFAPLGYKKK